MSAGSSRTNGHFRNLTEMMERCGVNLARFAQKRFGTTMVATVETCLDCPNPKTCRDWLDSREDGVVQEPPAFCPNAQRFRRAAGG